METATLTSRISAYMIREVGTCQGHFSLYKLNSAVHCQVEFYYSPAITVSLCALESSSYHTLQVLASAYIKASKNVMVHTSLIAWPSHFRRAGCIAHHQHVEGSGKGTRYTLLSADIYQAVTRQLTKTLRGISNLVKMALNG